MNIENFSYWLQGYAEICGEVPTEQQWDLIKKHLDSCFAKDPKIHSQPVMIIEKNPLETTYCRKSPVLDCSPQLLC